MLPALIDGQSLDAFAERSSLGLRQRFDELLAFPVEIPEWVGPSSRRLLQEDPEFLVTQSFALRGRADAFGPIVEVLDEPPAEIATLIEMGRELFESMDAASAMYSDVADDNSDGLSGDVAEQFAGERKEAEALRSTWRQFRSEGGAWIPALGTALDVLWKVLATPVATSPSLVREGEDCSVRWNSLSQSLRTHLTDTYQSAYDDARARGLRIVRGAREAIPLLASGSPRQIFRALAVTVFQTYRAVAPLSKENLSDGVVTLALECICREESIWACRDAIRVRERAARNATYEHKFLGEARRVHATLKGRGKPLAQMVDDLLTYRESNAIDDPDNAFGVPLAEVPVDRVEVIAGVFGVSVPEMSSGLDRAVRFGQSRSVA